MVILEQKEIEVNYKSQHMKLEFFYRLLYAFVGSFLLNGSGMGKKKKLNQILMAKPHFCLCSYLDMAATFNTAFTTEVNFKSFLEL